MKQYKITFYYRDRKPFKRTVDFYREFETIKELKEWAKYWMNESALYARYSYAEISINEYINHI